MKLFFVSFLLAGLVAVPSFGVESKEIDIEIFSRLPDADKQREADLSARSDARWKVMQALLDERNQDKGLHLRLASMFPEDPKTPMNLYESPQVIADSLAFVLMGLETPYTESQVAIFLAFLRYPSNLYSTAFDGFPNLAKKNLLTPEAELFIAQQAIASFKDPFTDVGGELFAKISEASMLRPETVKLVEQALTGIPSDQAPNLVAGMLHFYRHTGNMESFSKYAVRLIDRRYPSAAFKKLRKSEIKLPRLLDAFYQGLVRSSHRESGEILRGLEHVGKLDVKFVPVLVKLLESPEVETQIAAAAAIAKQSSSYEALQLALKKARALAEASDATIRERAAKILGAGIVKAFILEQNAPFERSAYLALAKLALVQKGQPWAAGVVEQTVRISALSALTDVALALKEDAVLKKEFFESLNVSIQGREFLYGEVLNALVTSFNEEPSDRVKWHWHTLMDKIAAKNREFEDCGDALVAAKSLPRRSSKVFN